MRSRFFSDTSFSNGFCFESILFLFSVRAATCRGGAVFTILRVTSGVRGDRTFGRSFGRGGGVSRRSMFVAWVFKNEFQVRLRRIISGPGKSRWRTMEDAMSASRRLTGVHILAQAFSDPLSQPCQPYIEVIGPSSSIYLDQQIHSMVNFLRHGTAATSSIRMCNSGARMETCHFIRIAGLSKHHGPVQSQHRKLANISSSFCRISISAHLSCII